MSRDETESMMEDTPMQPAPDKLYDHHRQQLSAMLDGALSPDAARFMLRRLQHDTELAACWERWQVCGDVMRGQRHALLPADFAQRVATAIAAAPVAAPAGVQAGPAPRWARWGGGAAIAASVAMIAMFVGRQDAALELAPGRQVAAGVVVDAAAPAAVSSPQGGALVGESATAATAMAAVPAPDPVSADPAAADVAELPRRAGEQRSRGQSQRAAWRAATRAAPPVAAMAAAAPAEAQSPFNGQAADGFVSPTLIAPARPWPRAILPSYPANAALSVEYGPAGSSAFSPFGSPVGGVDGARVPATPQSAQSDPSGDSPRE